MQLSDLLSLLCGLGLFLFGMKYMGDGLQTAAGPKMTDLMERLTRTPFRGFLLGTLVTVIIQSSSATTVMSMGFINAGIMTLQQATGVIIGANIGTTITSVLIALDISFIAPACIFAGAILMLFCKKARWRHIGQIILGFGLLFQGLHTMSGAMAFLKDSQAVKDFIATATNPVVGLLVGIVLCAIIQSSSAAVGILQVLALQGIIPLQFAAYLVCGINIGSAMPPFLSSIGAKNNAKRAAWIYFIYNVAGAILFLPITLLTPYTDWIISLFPGNASVQVSAYHIIFKVVTAIVLLPLTNRIVKLTYRFVPKKEHEELEHRLLYIDPRIVSASPITLRQIRREVERMAQLAHDNLRLAADGLLQNDASHVRQIEEQEELLNFLNHAVTDYLVKVNRLELSEDVSQYIGNVFHVINDLERVGDHALNLSEKTVQLNDKGFSYTQPALDELREITDRCLTLLDRATHAFYEQAISPEEEVALHNMEEDVDRLTIAAQDHHIERLRAGECHTEPGIIYVKALHDLERVGDHCYNIVWASKSDATLEHIAPEDV